MLPWKSCSIFLSNDYHHTKSRWCFFLLLPHQRIERVQGWSSCWQVITKWETGWPPKMASLKRKSLCAYSSVTPWLHVARWRYTSWLQTFLTSNLTDVSGHSKLPLLSSRGIVWQYPLDKSVGETQERYGSTGGEKHHLHVLELNSFSGAFTKLRKATIGLFMSVCSSVRV